MSSLRTATLDELEGCLLDGRTLEQSVEEYGATQAALDNAIAQAEVDGFEVVTAAPDVLLLDLDSPAAEAQFARVLPVVTEKFRVIEQTWWPSKSGNRHVRLRLAEDHAPAVRYALELALGSDGVRGALEIVQMYAGCEEPSILFKPER